MEGDHVAAAQKFFKRHLLHVAIGDGTATVHQHLHTEGTCHIPHTATNGAVAHDTNGLAAQLHQRDREIRKGAAANPIALCHGGVILVDTVGERQNKGEGVLCHRLGGIAGDVAHRHAVGGGVVRIDIVISRGE